MHPRRVAVIGSGVAGLLAAHVASRTAEVTLYESDRRLGGHADTHRVPDPATGRELAIDTGFIVHNERTYPTLLRLFAELGVQSRPSEMSLSVSDRGTGVEWAGALGPRGLFPSGRNLRDPHYLRMLTEIPRFHRHAKRLLAGTDATPAGDLATLRSFLDAHGFTPYFRRHFMEPLVAAVWSTDPADALDYPAAYLFTFLDHHGMLGVFGSPTWRTVEGGSHAYVDAVAAALTAAGGKIALDAAVVAVNEHDDGVRVATESGTEEYDAAVIATHPAAALGMLAAPTAAQTEVLSAIPYAANTALLHTDTSLLPDAPAARASWNFRRPERLGGPVLVTYDLTRLQRLDTPQHYLVTLGGEHLVDPATVIARRAYEHPQYSPASVAAQARLPEIDTDRIVFAGAYHGWGFHEDGARSGLAAAERLGFSWPAGAVVPDLSVAAAGSPSPGSGVRRDPGRTAARTAYATTLTHTRRAPLRHRFRLHTRMWVVDLDDVAATRPPAGWRRGTFEGRDHFTGATTTIREGLDTFLAQAGLDLRGGRALMAAQPRALGHCFNPISVHWVWRSPDGPETGAAPDATVVEVHNTYGDRHAYLLDMDEDGRGEVDKAMYVSPFHGTDGRYVVHAPPPTGDPDGRLRLAVTLDPGDQTPEAGRFGAALTGRPAPEPRVALAGLRGTVSIHLHGVWLWLRRLPVQPRPTDHPAPHGARPGGKR
ncbi:FAD-dependent oxidoreductase [Nocardioides sambongensis]|uniref:FAD-dependent oxidoreductase n=1 Tax=Nocardioides sambongensis TaxID=2589074 RepID=UPI00112AC6F2|nr:FAD-dependent oxidoreductase [Nocardioides sambongensis]